MAWSFPITFCNSTGRYTRSAIVSWKRCQGSFSRQRLCHSWRASARCGEQRAALADPVVWRSSAPLQPLGALGLWRRLWTRLGAGSPKKESIKHPPRARGLRRCSTSGPSPAVALHRGPSPTAADGFWKIESSAALTDISDESKRCSHMESALQQLASAKLLEKRRVLHGGQARSLKLVQTYFGIVFVLCSCHQKLASSIERKECSLLRKY